MIDVGGGTNEWLMRWVPMIHVGGNCAYIIIGTTIGISHHTTVSTPGGYQRFSVVLEG